MWRIREGYEAFAVPKGPALLLAVEGNGPQVTLRPRTNAGGATLAGLAHGPFSLCGLWFSVSPVKESVREKKDTCCFRWFPVSTGRLSDVVCLAFTWTYKMLTRSGSSYQTPCAPWLALDQLIPKDSMLHWLALELLGLILTIRSLDEPSCVPPWPSTRGVRPRQPRNRCLQQKSSSWS